MEILEKFSAIVASHIPNAEQHFHIVDSTSLADLEMDSLTIMSMITAIEQDYGVTLPETCLAAGLDTTLGNLWGSVQHALAMVG